MRGQGLIAGTGHTVSTLLIGLVVWIAGVAFATKFGNLVSVVSGSALIAFGAWIAFSSLRELHMGDGHGHSHGHEHEAIHGGNVEEHDRPHVHQQHEQRRHIHEADDALYVPSGAGTTVRTKHTHAHRHARSTVHVHLHDHGPDTWHPEVVDLEDVPDHEHRH